MGLDQYAFKVKSKGKSKKKEEREELAYWRKHNRLQGWMEALYIEKGGTAEFNCVDLELTAEDIDRLENVIKAKALPATGGFFFGSDSYKEYEEWYKKDDEKFIKDARKAIADGYTLYYSCWW